MRRTLVSALAASTAKLLIAQTCTWTGGAKDGLWGSSGNWDVVPTSGSDTLVLNSTGLPEVDGVPTMKNNKGGFTTGLLRIAPGSGSFKLTGDQLTLGGYITPNADSSKVSMTYDTASFACNAGNAKIEITNAIRIYGQRGFWLGENTDVTFSGKFTDNNGNKAYIYKYGPASSKFTLSGELAYEGNSETTGFEKTQLHVRGGTNVLSAAACSKAGAQIWVSGPTGTAVRFLSGTHSADVIVREVGETGTLDVFFDGTTEFNGAIKMMTMTQNLQFHADARCAFNSDIFFNNYTYNFYLYGKNADYVFANGITTKDSSNKVQKLHLNLDGGSLIFDKPVIGIEGVKDETTDTAAAVCRINDTFGTPGSFYLGCCNVIFGKKNVLPVTTGLEWAYQATATKGVYDLNGFDQTVKRLTSWGSDNNQGGRLVTSAKPAVLTIKTDATLTSANPTRVSGAISVVYDPQTAYTYTMTDFMSTSTGDFIVKSGTFKLTGAKSTIANASSIKVAAGATLEVDSSVTAPFGGNKPLFDISSTAALKLGKDVDLSMIKVDGEYVGGGRYQAQDGTDPTATKVGWLTGSAVLTVDNASFWKKSVTSGSWGASGNWNGGVPVPTAPAYIINEGASYTVRVDSAAEVGDLEVKNDGDNASVVAVSNRFSVAKSAKVALEKGGEIEVGTGGEFSFTPEPTADGASGLILGKGGKLRVEGEGSATIKAGNSHCPIYQNGGDIEVCGNGTLNLGGIQYANYFGTGRTVFSDNAQLLFSRGAAEAVKPRVYSAALHSGETNLIEFTGNSSVSMASEYDLDMFALGKAAKGGTSIMRCSGSGVRDFGVAFKVGADYGYAELDVSGGVVSTSLCGMEIGTFDYGTKKETDVTGVLKVRENGMVAIGGGLAFSAANRLRGFCVGGGWYHPDSYGNWFKGMVELSGGVISNNNGCVTLGAGRAEGRIVQTGGEFKSVASSSKGAMVVGFLGGQGEYILSNGVASVGYDVYVGGALTNRVGFCPDAGCPIGHDAQGVLSVAGGQFATAGDLVMSADGTGTLEVGSAGQVIAGNVILSNGTYSVKTSTVKFMFGANGVGKVQSSGRLDIASGAKLKIDLSAYTADPKGFTLISYASREGEFAEKDIEIVGWDRPQNPIKVHQLAKSIRLSMGRGMLIVVQ